MTKAKTKPVAPTRKKPAEPTDAGSDQVQEEAYQVEKLVAATAGKATSEGTAVKRRRADKPTIKRALEDLGINKPYYSARVVGNRLELTLYGGDVVTWPPEED